MRKIVLLFALFGMTSCGASKNPYVKSDIKLSIEEYQKTAFSMQMKGKNQEALHYLNQALKLAYSIDSVDKILEINNVIGEIYLRIGELNNASNFIYSAYNMLEFEGREVDFDTLLNIVKLKVKIAERDGLDRNLNDIEELYEKVRNKARSPENKAIYFNSYGNFLLRIKRYKEALESFGKAKELNLSRKNYILLADNYYNIGRVYEEMKSYEQALKNYEFALYYDRMTESVYNVFSDIRKIARMYLYLGNREKGYYYFNKAKEIARSMNDNSLLNEVEEEIIRGK